MAVTGPKTKREEEALSHFTVLVIGEDPEALLAPYDENIDVEPYRRYEDAAIPKDRWDFASLIESGALAEAATWQEYAEACNAKYETSEDSSEYLHYDAETDRVYTMSTYNPKSKWDWFSLGGRWTGFFKLANGATGTLGRSGIMTDPAKPGWADQARKRDIDWDGMRAFAEAEAIREHAKVTAALDGLPALVGWTRVREQMFPGDIDSARHFYNSQPGVKALRDGGLGTWDCPVETYFLDGEDPAGRYIAKRVARAGLPFAICTRDGWMEKGHMGWWAVVTDETADWDTLAQMEIANAPDDALFSLYDCHI